MTRSFLLAQTSKYRLIQSFQSTSSASRVNHGPVARSAHAHSSSVTARLLEDLAVRPFISLPIDFDGLVPSPHVVHELPVLRPVKLAQLVAVDVWRNIECRTRILTADHERAPDDRVVGHAIHRRTTEKVFA